MALTEKNVKRIGEQATNKDHWREIAEQAYNARRETKVVQKTQTVWYGGTYFHVVHVTIPDIKHKLAGMLGINTSITNNPVCIARREWALENEKWDCVCLYCYADGLVNRYDALENACLYNQHILNSHLLEEIELKAIVLMAEFVRFEMFGDVSSVMQARNYIRIAKSHPFNRFGAWSKNHNFWRQAFEMEGGKPENMTYILSSVCMDKVDAVPVWMEKYVDYVFTVCSTRATYERFLALYAGNCKACAGVNCLMECKCHCYIKGNAKYIFELKR